MARSEWRDESRGLAQLPLTLYTPREKKKGRGGVGYNGTCQRRASKQEYLLLLRVKRHLFYACTYSR